MSLKKIFTLSSIIFLGYVLMGFLCYRFNDSSYFVSLAYVIISFLPVLLGALVVKKFGITSKKGQPLALLVLGFLLWAIGEAIWFVFDYHLGIDPFPSIADYFFISAYLFLFACLIREVRTEKIRPRDLSMQMKLSMFVFLSALSMTVAIIFFYALQIGTPLLETIIHFFYGFGDITLIIISSLILIIIKEYQGGSYSKAWTLFLFGFLAHLFSDLLFEMLDSIYEGYVALFIDSFWVLGYILFFAGMLVFWSSLNKIFKLDKNLLSS